MIIHYLNLSDVDVMIIHYLNLSDVDVMIIHYLNLSDVDVIIIHYLNPSDVDVMIINYLNQSYFAGAPSHYLQHPLAKSLNDKIARSKQSTKYRCQRKLMPLGIRSIMKEERCYLPDVSMIDRGVASLFCSASNQTWKGWSRVSKNCLTRCKMVRSEVKHG